MAEKTIRHGIFTWVSVGGSNCMAFHGQTVDIDNPAEIERGEKEGAFFPEVGQEAEKSGNLLALDAKASDEKIKAYLAAGTTDEIVAQSSGYTADQVTRLIDLEAGRKEPRQRLLDELGGVVIHLDEKERLAAEEAETQPTLSPELSDDELAEFVAKTNAKKIEEQVDGQPVELLQRVRDTEAGRTKPRKTVIDALDKAIAESSPSPDDEPDTPED